MWVLRSLKVIILGKNTTRIKTKFHHNACPLNFVRLVMLAQKNLGKHQWESHYCDCGG